MKKLLILAALAVGVFVFASATAEARPYGSSYSHGYRGSSSCGKSYHGSRYRHPSYRPSSSFSISFGYRSPSYGYYRPCPPPVVYRPCPPPVVYRSCPPPVGYRPYR